MKITHNHWVGLDRALAMLRAARGTLTRLGVLIMGGVVLASTSVRAQEIVVPRDFPTIQAAVDAAPPGATIRVRPGTYTEEVVIAKDLTLQGAGVHSTHIKAPQTLTPFGLNLQNGVPVTAVVLITDGARVNMSGFTVTGPIPCGVVVSGVRAIKDANLELTDSRVTRMRPEGGTCCGARTRDHTLLQCKTRSQRRPQRRRSA